MKKRVTVIMLLILVLSAFAALSAPNVKAQTTEAVIKSYTWYVAPANTVLALSEGGYAGDLVVVGEVENTGTTTLGLIVIGGAAYNSTPYLVCTSEDPVIAVPLLPGQKAPFYMDFNPLESVTRDDSWVNDVTNVTLRVIIADATNQTQYTDLTTTGLNGFDNSGVYTVTGYVENTGSQTPQNVWVATTFYNSAGKVIGLNYTAYLNPTPGNSVSFVATPTDNSAALSNDVGSYSVLVVSSPPSSGTPPPTSSSTASPTTSPSSSATPKQTQAPMNSLLIYGAVIAVVIIVAALAALMLLRSRRKKGQFDQQLPPPPPPPPPPP